MAHSPRRGRRRFWSSGYYVLASERLRGRTTKLRPHVLIDAPNLAAGETYLADADDEDAFAGLQFRLAL